MQRIILYILTVLCLFSCDDDLPNSDLSGDKNIRGRLFLVDTLTQQANGIPLAKKKINISYATSTDSNNFLLSTTTDDEGYFVFQNLKNGSRYRIRYEEKIGDILYALNEEVAAPNETLQLNATIATSKQSGFYLTIVDPAGNKIKGVDICVFTNRMLFNSRNCDASNLKIKSDDYGRVPKFGILPGKYYFYASFGINNSNYTIKDSISVKDKQVLSGKLTLQRANGFEYTLVDPAGAKISGATLCVFTSRTLFTGTNCNGKAFELISDINGRATRNDLTPGKYFIYSFIQAGNVILESKDSVVVEDKTVSKILMLKPKINSNPGGFKYTLVDPTGAKISGATLCVFTSRTLFTGSNCDGKAFDATSDVNGVAEKKNLAAGKYFIYSSIKTGDIMLENIDSVVVEDKIVDKVLLLKPKVPVFSGFEYTVVDSTGAIISNATLCFFTSKVLFSGTNCSGNAFQLISDLNGKVSKKDLSPGKYYVYGSIITDSLTLAETDTVMVTNKSVVNKILVLNKVKKK